jgi:hypothetical protein
LANDVIRGDTAHVTSQPDPAEVEIEERKAMATDSVPEPYLDAWARLQVQKPMAVPDAKWRLAIDDGGLFLDQWAGLALEFGWSIDELFGRDGLAWFLEGESVQALGPEHAVTVAGRVFDSLKNNQRKSNAAPT